MNTLYQRAYAQSGKELLNGNLEPSCYASVMSETAGDSAKALALYSQRRAEAIYIELLKLEEDGKRRLKAMNLTPNRARYRSPDNDLFRPLLLMIVIFLGSTSALLFFCGSIHGELCIQSLGKIVTTAVAFVALGILGAILIRLKKPRLSYAAAMMPFAMFFALSSFGSASYMVKTGKKVSWNANIGLEQVSSEMSLAQVK